MSQPKIMIVEARFYEDLADEMAAGAIAAIEACGGTYERFAVRGRSRFRRRSNLPFEAWILTRVAVGLTVMLLWAASSEAKPRITIMSAARRARVNGSGQSIYSRDWLRHPHDGEPRTSVGPRVEGCRQQRGRCGERLS